ncbi:hypothetical protein PJ900_03800 (plasmid) [Tistrella mobilis]|uniref:hypothetical protein n=1 Tax=Tistrella mobilis TaxID=171437 RepID=UPI0012E87A84|nr:hypothetical protein [Tistrella mobilis]
MNAAQEVGLERIVFLAGPYIKSAAKPRRSTKNRAALLRYGLYHRLQDEGWIVTMGEYEALIHASDPKFGELNNAVLAEVNHAKKESTDAIIMLPSSAGSFLELGAFSCIESICLKMIIIIDAQYEKDNSYMNLGPLKQAKENHADVHFINYSDFDKCWEVVEKYIRKRAHKRIARETLS